MDRVEASGVELNRLSFDQGPQAGNPADNFYLAQQQELSNGQQTLENEIPAWFIPGQPFTSRLFADRKENDERLLLSPLSIMSSGRPKLKPLPPL
jgi:hypothetical protein